MTRHLYGGRLQWVLLVIALAIGACGGGGKKTPDAGVGDAGVDTPTGATPCVLGQSTLDNCTL